MISGKRSERLQTVERQAQMLRRDLDQLRARQASQSPTVKARLARIEAPVAAGYNTFAVTFLNGEFSETSGVTTPAYADRGTGFAHNLRSADMNVGDIVKVWPWSGRWWFERGVSGPPPQVFFDWTGYWEPGAAFFTAVAFTDPFSEGSGPFWGYQVLAQGSSPGIYRQWSGFISFDNVLVDQGATITSAVLRMNFNANPLGSAYPSWNTGVTPPGWQFLPQARYRARCDIYGEAADDANVITSAADADSRVRTTASVPQYSHYMDITAGPNFVSQYAPGAAIADIDVTAIVQEIVNRPGWAPTNRMMFLFDENGTDQNTVPGVPVDDITSLYGGIGARDAPGGPDSYIELVIT